ncbi:hypothetical protein DMENIID0001_042640 [Sergentomyia squamirostris]
MGSRGSALLEETITFTTSSTIHSISQQKDPTFFRSLKTSDTRFPGGDKASFDVHGFFIFAIRIVFLTILLLILILHFEIGVIRFLHSAVIYVRPLKQANSRASIAGPHHLNHHQVVTNSRHYGNRSHSEADLLADTYDYDSRLYAPSRARSDQVLLSRRQSPMGLVYPNIQAHSLDVVPGVRGVSLQAKAGDLFAIMATSQKEGTALKWKVSLG